MLKIAEYRQAHKLNGYRDYAIGKLYISYGGGIDQIIDITIGESLVYTVVDIENLEIRQHATPIKISELFS